MSLSGQQGVQHFVAQSHLKRFASGKKGDGKFFIYDKSSPSYKNGLARRIKGGRYERKSPRDLALYEGYHSHSAELKMGDVERQMSDEWSRIKDMEGIFGPKTIPAILRYMGLSEIRRPDNLHEWGRAVSRETGLILLDDTLRALATEEEPLQALQTTIEALPCWKVHTLEPESDEEYLISDNPAQIAFAGRAGVAHERSLALMPMSKKKVLVGFWDEDAIELLTFNARSVNGMAFFRARREVYSHRLLDSEMIKSFVSMEPLLRWASLPGSRVEGNRLIVKL